LPPIGPLYPPRRSDSFGNIELSRQETPETVDFAKSNWAIEHKNHEQHLSKIVNMQVKSITANQQNIDSGLRNSSSTWNNPLDRKGRNFLRGDSEQKKCPEASAALNNRFFLGDFASRNDEATPEGVFVFDNHPLLRFPIRKEQWISLVLLLLKIQCWIPISLLES
jgi:hypothetical protein